MFRTRWLNRFPKTASLKLRRAAWLATGLLFIQYLLLIRGVKAVYFTADEPAYIAGGYALLARGSEAFPFLAQRGYPPLLAGVEALFLYGANPHIPVTELAGWPDSYDRFVGAFEPYLAPIERTLFLTRLPTMWLMLLLAAVVFRWAKSLWGRNAALLALVALVFDPLLLANGRLAHTDAGIVALGTAALYAVWLWAKTLRLRWAVASGILLALTLLAKVSGVFYVLAAAIGVLATLRRCWETQQRQQALRQGLLLLGLGGGLFWAGYALTWGPVTGFPLPLPAPAYWESVRYLRHYSSEVFALGKQWYIYLWWYYPVSFVIKNPLLLLAAFLLGLVQLLRRPVLSASALVLWAFPVIYTLTALLIGMNIGYRHMLPIHPYLYLIIGGGVVQWSKTGRPWRDWLVMGGCLAYAVGALLIFPRELSFFNSLVGGSRAGYRYLTDSNIDWGQTPPATIAAFVQDHVGIETAPPSAPFRPAAGQYLISASALQGMGTNTPLIYRWFREQEPTAFLGNALLVYDVSPFALSWLAQCELPVPPLTAETIAQKTGKPDLRIVGFDCTQTWVYPANGGQTGIYALNYELFSRAQLQLPSFLFGLPDPTDSFIARHLANMRLSYEKAHADATPAFVLYEADLPPMPPAYPQTGKLGPAALSPAEVEPLGLWPQAAVLNETLVFLGTTLTLDGDDWEVASWWRVRGEGVKRPFSIMAHLVTRDGQLIAIADGLGVSPLALRSGDVVVQRHRFSQPPAGQSYWLKTGAYWLDTLEQWPVDGTPNADALFIPLTPSATRKDR